MNTQDALDVLQTGKRAAWYKRAWRHLRISRDTSFGIRGFLMMALMLCGIGWIANATSTTIWHAMMGDYDVGPIVRLNGLHLLATIAATVFAAIIGLRFGFRQWNSRPFGSRLPIRRLFVALQDRARSYRHFLLLNLSLITTYAIVADQSWNRMRRWMWNEEIDWATVYQFMMGLVGIAISGGLIWLGWRGIQHVRTIFGRCALYARELEELQDELANERRAHAKLCEVVPMVGQCLATGIVRIRLGKGRPQSEQNRLLVDARTVLQNALCVLITDETTRYAMLERSRRTAEGEDEPQPSAPTTPSQA